MSGVAQDVGIFIGLVVYLVVAPAALAFVGMRIDDHLRRPRLPRATMVKR